MYTIRKRQVFRQQVRDMIEIDAADINSNFKQNKTENYWCTLPADFELLYDKIYNFEIYDDDVFLATFPKCGTSWMQEAAWLLLNDLNFSKAKEINLNERSIFLDFSALYKDAPQNSIANAAKLPRPRLIKTHLPPHLMPWQIWQKKIKIIYCARNPKDVAVSFYHFHKGLGTWQGSIDDFVNDFINADLMYTPFWPNILDFWHMRNEPHIFFTTYENMKHDLRSVLVKLNEFLEKPALSEENLRILLEHLNFDSMKANPKINPTEGMLKRNERVSKDLQFMRRGIIGAYRDELCEESQQKIDEWSSKYLLAEGLTENDIFTSS